MNFIEDFIKELNQLPLYEVDTGEKKIKTIEVSLVCDLLTVLFDKYGFEGAINDDLHG